MLIIDVLGESLTTMNILKSETYNDIIARLIDVYESIYFDEFSDEKAEYYNERIKHFENGDYTGTRKVDLNAIRRR